MFSCLGTEEEEEHFLMKVGLARLMSRMSSGTVGEKTKGILTLTFSGCTISGFSMERLFYLVLDKQEETIERLI